MKKSNKGLFLLAFILALVGTGALFVYLKGMEKPVVTQIETVNIVVAATDIPARAQITPEMLKWISVPKETALTNVFKTQDDIIGKFARETIYVEQPIHPNAIVEEITDELSLKISGNNRAVTVNVNGSSGVDGLIKPGDFVDVILFLPQIEESSRIVRPDIAKLFLQKVEVLAIDQTLYRDEKTDTGEEETEASGSYFVTLSVPVMDVEMLVLAKDVGLIELALRPTDSDYLYVTEGAIWQELLLNDSSQMKDMFPEYSVIGTETGTEPVTTGNVSYDSYIYYVVAYGDTLKSISLKYYGTDIYATLIQDVNKIEDIDMILTGTGIKIPVLKEGEVEDGN